MRLLTVPGVASPPDGFTFRTGTTTVVDPGSSGWRNFDDFKTRIIDVSRTRVLAMLNIVGYGTAGAARENELNDMEVPSRPWRWPSSTRVFVVGIKTAHYAGPEWDPFSRSVEAGKLADIPVMVDFGSAKVRTIKELFKKAFRPGDIFHALLRGNAG